MEITDKHTFILEMNKEEAEWLKNLLQNPISEDETPSDGDMRELFFGELVLI